MTLQEPDFAKASLHRSFGRVFSFIERRSLSRLCDELPSTGTKQDNGRSHPRGPFERQRGTETRSSVDRSRKEALVHVVVQVAPRFLSLPRMRRCARSCTIGRCLGHRACVGVGPLCVLKYLCRAFHGMEGKILYVCHPTYCFVLLPLVCRVCPLGVFVPFFDVRVFLPFSFLFRGSLGVYPCSVVSLLSFLDWLHSSAHRGRACFTTSPSVVLCLPWDGFLSHDVTTFHEIPSIFHHATVAPPARLLRLHRLRGGKHHVRRVWMGKRPEGTTTAQLAYRGERADRYARSSRALRIQEQLTRRALELLALPDACQGYLLDVGCGTGMSGRVLEQCGHEWIGVDLSHDMLQHARAHAEPNDPARTHPSTLQPMEDDEETEEEEEASDDSDEEDRDDAEPMHARGPCQVAAVDLGHGLPFRPGTFDGAVSISAIQWLCNAETSQQDPRRRIATFFRSLYRCLARGSRAVLQFYPENQAQAHMLTTAAMKVGFSGGLLVDYPNSAKAKKYFLVLMCGPPRPDQSMPKALTEEHAQEGQQVSVHERRKAKKRMHRRERASGTGSKRHPEQKGKTWVLHKKELYRQRGRTDIPSDSKYTARKRKRLPI